MAGAWLRKVAHRRGWLASPSLAYQGVPFGPEGRDLAAEIAVSVWRDHDAGQCAICFPDTYRSGPADTRG
jgi:hypothetical protein